MRQHFHLPSLLSASLAAVLLAAGYAAFSVFSGSDGSAAMADQKVSHPSKAPRETRSSSALADRGKSKKEAKDKEREAAAVASAEVSALADGRVVKREEALAHGLASNGGQVTSEAPKAQSDLKKRLLERAGRLAVHAEEPWNALVLVAVSYHRLGDDEASEAWFARAIRLASDPDSPQESSLAHRAIVKGLLSVGEIDSALELVYRIPLPRYRDLARTDVVKTIAFRKDFQRALAITRDLEEARSLALALRAVAEAQARFDTLQHAMETVSEIPAGRSRDDAISQVALARGMIGDRSGATQLVGKIVDEQLRDRALVRLTSLASRSGVGSPEAFLSLVNDPFLRDQSLLRLVEQRVSRMKFSEAQIAAARIENKSEHAVAMELLVSLQLRQGNLRGALKRARFIDVQDSRDRALQEVAMQQVVKQGPPSARFTADLIEGDRLRDVTYRKIAERSASLGIYQQISPTIGEIENVVERASAFASVASLQARRGFFRPANNMISEAEDLVATITGRRQQGQAMGFLASAYLEAGNEIAAMNVAAEIEDAGLRDRTYQQLSRKLAALSEIALAEQSALAIEKEATRERALDEVARVVAGRTRATEALSRFKMFDGRRQQVKFLLEVARRI